MRSGITRLQAGRASGTRPQGDRSGVSLVELVTAVMLLGLGLIGLAAGSGWMTDVHPTIGSDPGRAVALQAAVEEVVAMDLDDVAPGVRRYGGFEVTWTLLEETHDTVLVRFIVVDVARTRAGVEPGPGSDPTADTLEYRRARS